METELMRVLLRLHEMQQREEIEVWELRSEIERLKKPRRNVMLIVRTPAGKHWIEDGRKCNHRGFGKFLPVEASITEINQTFVALFEEMVGFFPRTPT